MAAAQQAAEGVLVPCAQADASAVYRPRQPRASPLYRIVERHYPEFQRVYRQRYQERYGAWRPINRPTRHRP